MDIFTLKASVSEMSEEELVNTIQDIRRNRRNVAREPAKAKKAKAPEPMQLDYANMKVDALEQLLLALGGEDEPQV
jgi:hypothetical protein